MITNEQMVKKIASIKTFTEGKEDLITLEIGSWIGHGTSILALSSKEVVCVDWWKGSVGVENEQMRYPAVSPVIFALFQYNLTRVWDKIHPMIGDHRSTLPLLRDKTFDLVCVDGDHRYSEVAFDIKEARRVVKPGGLIFGHDYEINPAGVSEEALQAHKEEDAIDGTYAGVILSVREAFGGDFEYGDGYWWVNK